MYHNNKKNIHTYFFGIQKAIFFYVMEWFQAILLLLLMMLVSWLRALVIEVRRIINAGGSGSAYNYPPQYQQHPRSV